MEYFPIFKLPNELVGYTLKFVNPSEFYRLYRVCKKINNMVSDRSFLLNKLEYDLSVPKSELEPLYDLKSSLRELTPLLRYIRVLAFYYKIIPSSTAWLGLNMCISISVRNKQEDLIRYFMPKLADKTIAKITGRYFDEDNYLECIDAYLRGETVRCENKHFELLTGIFNYVKAIVKGYDPPELKRYQDSLARVLEWLVKRGKISHAFEFIKKYNIPLGQLEMFIFEKFLGEENLDACKGLIVHKVSLNSMNLTDAKNPEFIRGYLKTFLDPNFRNEYKIWSPAFIEVFLDTIISTPKYLKSLSIPSLYLVKFKDLLIGKNFFQDLNATILYGDILRQEYGVKFTMSDHYCQCGKIPLVYKECGCSIILSCNFCKSKDYEICQLCDDPLCETCSQAFTCQCQKTICEACGGQTCDNCNTGICEKCGIFGNADLLCKLCAEGFSE